MNRKFMLFMREHYVSGRNSNSTHMYLSCFQSQPLTFYPSPKTAIRVSRVQSHVAKQHFNKTVVRDDDEGTTEGEGTEGPQAE